MFRDSLENIQFRKMFLEPYKVMMYQGEVPVNEEELEHNLPNPSYVLANINAGLDYGNFSVGMFVRNVFDKEAHLSLFQGFQSDNRVTPSSPRTIGATVTYNFGQ